MQYMKKKERCVNNRVGLNADCCAGYCKGVD